MKNKSGFGSGKRIERQMTGFGETVNLVEEDGSFYVMKGHGERKPREAKATYTYVRVDKEEYLNRLKMIAEKVATCPGVKLQDILMDALKDYPLSEIETIEERLGIAIKEAEETQAKPKVKTRPGHCCEVYIGRTPLFQIR